MTPMNPKTEAPGDLMQAESAEAPGVFCRALARPLPAPVAELAPRAVYTIARGSSDAAANILSYLYTRHLKIPVTSLPPSTFSLYGGVACGGATGLVISQSGASPDLVASAAGIQRGGGRVVAITNRPGSPVEQTAELTLPIDAGPELAVPATKSVVGAIAVGMALLAALRPGYRAQLDVASRAMEALTEAAPAGLQPALLRARHVFVVGRGTGFGAAQEIALKLKETSALHAEAYSASEVLHGPLQLATNPLLVLLLDTGEPETQPSLDQAEARLRAAGGEVVRLRPPAPEGCCPAAVAAMALTMVYPVVRATALALGKDPDSPSTLSKVTSTS